MKIFGAALLLLVGCTNTTDPILVDEMCVHEELVPMTQPIFVSCGNGCTRTQMVLTFVPHCTRRVAISYPNPDYKP